MNKNIIYTYVNNLLDSYILEGVQSDQLLTYLNTDESNYQVIFNKIYRKLTIDSIQFESNDLKECLVDSIRDKVSLLKDLKQI